MKKRRKETKKGNFNNDFRRDSIVLPYIFSGMSLNHTILNHNAIAWYCLIIPGDDTDEEKRLCMCVCARLNWCGCWRKCVKYVCHIRFDIEFLNRNCLRLLSCLWWHTPILCRAPTQMGQQTLLLFFLLLLLLAHVLSTLFKSNQNFFNIFDPVDFRSVIFHLHTNQVSKSLT